MKENNISIKAVEFLTQFLLLPKLVQDKLYIVLKYDMSYDDVLALVRSWTDYSLEDRKEFLKYKEKQLESKSKFKEN